jgi:hypothetical protein
VAPHPITLESYERKTGFLLLSDFLAEPHSLPIYFITATEKRKEEPQQSTRQLVERLAPLQQTISRREIPTNPTMRKTTSLAASGCNTTR